MIFMKWNYVEVLKYDFNIIVVILVLRMLWENWYEKKNGNVENFVDFLDYSLIEGGLWF